jgi:hypothetical protein
MNDYWVKDIGFCLDDAKAIFADARAFFSVAGPEMRGDFRVGMLFDDVYIRLMVWRRSRDFMCSFSISKKKPRQAHSRAMGEYGTGETQLAALDDCLQLIKETWSREK